MVGLPDAEKASRIYVTVYAQYWRVTDRRQTDILPRLSLRYAYALRGKNHLLAIILSIVKMIMC